MFASGTHITHQTTSGSETISQPDDITYLDDHGFVDFQNDVGPQGQTSTTGKKDSAVVEFDLKGHEVRQWDIVGKCDGLAADPAIDRVIATVNEDANSSLYVIRPAGTTAIHYRYNAPLPSDGGTDAITPYNGMILISASAPGTTGAAAPRASYPAVYQVVLHARSHIAHIHPLLYDEALAKVANTTAANHGKRVHLALTDPDSNADVPSYAPRFAGDFMLTSQGDEEQIFVSHAGAARQALSVLKLSASVDDTAWPSDRSGATYTTNNEANTIDKITGPFRKAPST